MSNQMKLKPDSEIYKQWRKPNIPLFMDIYLFNWTNPESFTNISSKPIMQELGPYRFVFFVYKSYSKLFQLISFILDSENNQKK